MIDLTMKLTDVIRTISGKIRADEDVPKSESVAYFLDIDYSDCTIADVLTYASADRKIAWATSGRKAIGKIKPGQHISIKASRPGSQPAEDPYDALLAKAKAANMSLEDYIKSEAAKRASK